jgi:hypothetical protein
MRETPKRKAAGALVALLFLSLASIEAHASQIAGRRHPRPEYLVRPEGVPVLPLQTAERSAQTEGLLARFRDARRVALIGAAEEPPEYVFGEIAGVVIGPRNRIYVLDSRFYEVRVFAPDGSVIETIGSPGPGPGEFTLPAAVTLRGEAMTFYVGDRIRRIHEFSLEREESLYSRSFVTRTDPESICSFRDAIVTGGESSGIPNAIHQYGTDGDMLGTFGAVYPSPHGAVNASLSNVLVACDPDDAFILFAPRQLGEVRRYSRGGELQWIVVAEDFRHAEIVEQGVMVYVTVPEDGFDQIDSLVFISPEHALVQIVEHTRNDAPPRAPRVDSYVLLTDNGEAQSIGSELPQILAITNEYFVTLEGILDPRLGIYEFTGEER